MFWKKKEKTVENKISNLEKRVCDLENPYKFNIGDYVCSELYSFSEQCTITNFGYVVSQNFEYHDEYYDLKYLLFPNSKNTINYKRFNSYTVFHEQQNSSITYKESELQLKIKKK